MAKFEVREVFRLPQRGELVIAGKITEGTVQVGMSAYVWLDGGLYWDLPVRSIEFLDRVSVGESLISLVCRENTEYDAELCSELCPIGSIIDVTDASSAV
ncbi:hypothetical protein RF679_13735 [Undibacterium cyanobacteriorum]|uniref:Translation elongation factor EFTu-like domain-containing protein n=1 Tax=Undibacterium cyanobacteriorum TaxID=3073561 RepID=A0ABY9RHE1_9BURK|nr:hypothetical protein [Undibacterium sp. 20NA77.5]WMW79707.1 hypothetical protein RF679_13735 [Undibacterium sp. 20NA77.5]